MDIHKVHFSWRTLGIRIAVILACVGILVSMPVPNTRRDQRLSALSRWKARSLVNYRIVVEIERLGRICAQELEVQGAQTRTLHDTCNASWITTVTVPQLFEFSSWMERGSDCYPSSLNCFCRRVRIGKIVYDPVLGYPALIDWRRDVRPNPNHPDFWKKIWEQRSLPQCVAVSRPFHISVMSFTPLP